MIYIYYGMCVFSICFAFMAQRKNSKRLFFLSTIIICFLVGFRGYTVGIDTKTYYTYVEWIQDGIFQTTDWGFYYFTKFLLNINNTAEFVICIYSVLMIAFIFYRFWSLRDKISLPLVEFIFLAFYLQLSMNIMRQFFSVAIIFSATRFLEKKKYVTYIIFNMIAVSFHKSSIVGFLILFIYYYINEKKNAKKQVVLFITFCMVPIIFVPFMGKYLDSYSIYLSYTNVNIGLMMFIKMGVLLVYIISRYKAFLSKNSNIIFDKVIFSIYFIGISFTTLGYFFTYMERIGLSFMIFEPVCLARMSSKSINSKIFLGFSIILSVFLILVNYMSNSNGVFPYTLFFMK